MEMQGLWATRTGWQKSQIQVLSHPVFGSLKDTTPTTKGSSSVQQLLSFGREKRSKSGFITSVTPVTESTAGGTGLPGPSVTKRSGKLCLFHSGSHKLESCFQLNKKAHKEKLEFLKKKRVCFGCLEAKDVLKDLLVKYVYSSIPPLCISPTVMQ